MAGEPRAEEIEAVRARVVQIIADALDRPATDVHADSSLIDDLGAESIDFLDIVFRLERAFKIKIPRGKILEEARGALSQAEFEQRGVLTPAGFTQLRSYMSEVPAERFRSPLKLADVPRLFTVATFCKVVVRART